MTYFVARDESGAITILARQQIVATDGTVITPEKLPDTHPDVAARLNAVPESGPRRLAAYRIVRRVEAAGKLEAAAALLDANPTLKWRFITAGGILVDDPDLIAGLRALGLDPDVVLAPDE